MLRCLGFVSMLTLTLTKVYVMLRIDHTTEMYWPIDDLLPGVASASH